MSQRARWMALSVVASGLALIVAARAVTLAQNEPAPAGQGEALYRAHCASCHDGLAQRAPARAALEQMTRSNILFAITKGDMKQQAASLTATEKVALADYLGKISGSGSSGHPTEELGTSPHPV